MGFGDGAIGAAKELARLCAEVILLMAVAQSTFLLSRASAQVSTALRSAASQATSPRFSVASVRRNRSDEEGSINVSPTSSDASQPTAGLYLGRNIVLISYISFAYRLTNLQLQSVVSQAPWTAEERYNIEARADGTPSTEEYRLMMQALLQERFKLTIHPEVRQKPVYAIILAVPGKLGKQMRLHAPNDPLCAARPDAAEATLRPAVKSPDGFPTLCGDLVSMPTSSPGRIKNGGRNVSLTLMASSLAGVGNVGRPMVDQTGLPGNVDFALEWATTAANVPSGGQFHPDESAPAFTTALKEQLGLKLRPQMGPVTFFIVDHIERPDEN